MEMRLNNELKKKKGKKEGQRLWKGKKRLAGNDLGKVK